MQDVAMTDEVTSPASYGQRRLWFFDRLQPLSALYNMRYVKPLPGLTDPAAVERAFGEIVRRHEILRTTFHNVGGVPVQVVHAPAAAPIPVVDLCDHQEEARDREFRRFMNELLVQAFDLERGPLFRAILMRLEPRRIMLLVSFHHIVFDDWSWDVFDREFSTLHEDARTGRPFSLPPLAMQYAAFAAQQRRQYDSGSLDPQLVYWRDRLRNLPAASEMPHDKPRPPVQTFKGAIHSSALAPPIAAAFRELTRAAGVTLFMSLFAAYAVLLHRHSGQDDLAVGTPVAERKRPELANSIGFFVNTLVLRIDLSDDPSFLDLMSRARDMALGAMANQDMPFERLVEDLRPARDPARQPMFQTMFVYHFGRQEGGDGELQDEMSTGAKFDLTLTATDAAPQIRLAFDYCTDLFSADAMARIAKHYETLIASIVAEPHRRISTLPMLTPTERHLIAAVSNATEIPLPMRPLAHEIVAAVASRQPDAAAVTFGEAILTYAGLNRRATALAAHLQRLGVGPEVRVGLCLERSPDWIAALLGCLRAGGVSVPLDPTLPADRLRFMIEDAGIALVLTEPGWEDKFAGGPARPIHFGEGVVDCDAPAASDKADPQNLAYVIYTSGSTGRPKGVMMEHAGLANLALAQGRAWAVDTTARVLQFAAPGFDAAMSEVFSTLCSGGCLHLARQDEMMPGPPLLRLLREERITHVTLPPSALAAMAPEALPDLRLIVSAGEPCDPALARRWAQDRRLVNAYGPTEITVCATMHDFDGGDIFPIGRPIANMRVYVLDRHGEPVPAGVSGEIHIGGIGVARGYLGRPDLTAERFIPDTLPGRPGRLYRTGDLGRFDASGVLHYLGRTDRQLKVRGYRIEPGEVESVLRSHPQVTDAAVLGLGTGPDARLIAYVVPSDPPPLVVALRGFVAGLLPDYMAPAAYVMVEHWPKTPNGKVDHAALPCPGSLTRETAASFVSPAGRLEEGIAAIWRDCLGIAEVGTEDNFFDLGGHSLLLVRVHGRLRDELKSDLSLVDLFRFPTIRLLAGAIESRSAGRPEAEAAALARAGQRAALQNAARVNRRYRHAGDRNA